MPPAAGQPRGYIPRHAEALISTALADTRIVAIIGPRQSGKTTLARRIAAADGRTLVSLDNDDSLRFARTDPAGFMRKLEFAAIDEIQRAPNLILALKMRVDEDPRPGRYLITGSVDMFNTMVVPDSLAGRVEVVELLPLSQAEIRRQRPPPFLARAFAGDFPHLRQTGFTEDLVRLVLTGGYPQFLSATSTKRRQAKLRDYAGLLAHHYLPEIMEVRKDARLLSGLVERAANASGRLVNLSRMASGLQVDVRTVDRWLELLERMFLVRRLRAWHRNQGKRLVKAARLHFVDSGLLAAMQQVDEAALAADRDRFGALLETFVLSEIAKLVPHHDSPIRISHYRDKDGREVGFVLETCAGATVGIEVKAATSIHPGDFRGLHRLADATGTNFAAGILLHDGERTFSAGERMFALPVKALWEDIA